MRTGKINGVWANKAGREIFYYRTCTSTGTWEREVQVQVPVPHRV